MVGERKSLGHDAFWSFAATGSRAVSAAIIFYLLASRLGPSNFGAYQALLAIFLLTAPFVVFGVMHPLTKLTSSEPELARAAWGAAILPAVLSSLVFAGFFTAIVPLVFSEISHVAVLALGLAEFLGYALVMTAAFLLNAINRFAISAAVTTFWSLMRLGSAVVTLVWLEPSITGASIGFLVAALVTAAVTTTTALRTVGSPVYSVKASIQMARDGLPYSFASSGSTVLNDVDKLMLFQIKGDEATGVYAGGNKILGLSAVPMFALLSATYPRFFAAGNESGVAGTRAMARKLSPIVVTYAILMGTALFFAAPLINPILGEGYSDSVSVVRWMVAMPLVNLCGLLAGEVLTGANYQGLRNKMIILAAVVNISLNAILIPLYSWGGAIAATYCSEATLLFSFLWWINRHRNDPARTSISAVREPATA